jgi:hypothetical protein
MLSIGCECKSDHFEAVCVWGDGCFGFEGLAVYRGEQDAVECEGICRGAGQAQMAAMDGVECAAEEGYAHSVMLEHFLSNCGVGNFMQCGFL